MNDGTTADAALLGLRLGLGAVLLIHGYGKLFGKPGLPATATWFDSIGMRPGRVNAVLAAATELVAGSALVLGLATALGSAAVVSLMVVAAATVTARRGFLAERGGWEYNGVLALVAIALAALGPGRWSLDHLVHSPGNGAARAAVAILVGVGAAVGLLALQKWSTPKVSAGTR
jgi:putative oxidoreductase